MNPVIDSSRRCRLTDFDHASHRAIFRSCFVSVAGMVLDATSVYQFCSLLNNAGEREARAPLRYALGDFPITRLNALLKALSDV